MTFDNIVGKRENAGNQHFFLFLLYTWDVLWDHLWCPREHGGGWGPVLCLEDIPKTILSTVMEFCGWVDLIKGECSAHEP